MIQKTNKMNLVEQVATQIEQLIESGSWEVGKKIPPEMELMEKFDVSRNTLREAIRALVHAGLLETKQGSGTIVRSANSLGAALKRYVKKTALLEILDVRLALEKQAAQLAAEHRTEADLAKLEEYIQLSRQAVKSKDWAQFIELDICFHKAVVLASTNQLLIDLYEPLLETINSFVQDLMAMNATFKFEEELHIDLLSAIRGQNKEAAATYVENYMELLRKEIIKMTGE
ncbi:FadR/GntR family transcriptional regulator [Rummeliibacillus stabekisii]|uniref:FadR/GntR family transcriptional regulator n=1 Tax=Rummeliibacillus stabekisii TaxID=241244 RepID=UPI00116E9991|nr:FadR/GntR family transcriptional regulator [Rummeliibacillus stabekisii]MBB5171735.1 DNA-binding FadR family transcriptional regulator [Rummeliibacillus stabekisii]GEL06340.1 GntR family transcriptional regulator [Rummeliibacillus stabekisii]